MSIKVMQWAWDFSLSEGVSRLVLLAIADCASEDGGNAYPSNVELMRKARCSERGVRNAISDLKGLGELEVAPNAGRKGTNMYRVIMIDRPRPGVPVATPRAPKPRGANPAGGQSVPARGANPAGEAAQIAPGTVLEPSVEPSVSTSAADASPPKSQEPGTEENGGTIVKGFIDWLAARPSPVKLGPQVIARYGMHSKTLLKAGIPPQVIKHAMVLMHERGKAGWPSMLESFVVEVQAGTPSKPAAPRSFAQQDVDAKKRQRDIAKLADAYAEREGIKLGKDRALTRQIIAEATKFYDQQIKGIETSSAGVYSGAEAVNGAVVAAPLEVTAS